MQCGQPVRAQFQQVVDAQAEPQAKMNLLAGRLNAAVCPNCGALNTIMTPLIYHDASKELVISFVPMELGLTKEAQEKVIGDMMREVTSQLPPGGFKGYLLQPRSALTYQGLVDQVLQADGVTPAMMEAQRARARLLETLLEADDADLPRIIQQNDAEIDAQLLQMMTLLAQRMVAEGRQAAAERVVMVQNFMVEHSSFGQKLLEQSQRQETVIQEVAAAVNSLGETAQRADFLDMALKYADDDQRLQALVGLVRPAFDYQFFQELTLRIGQAAAAERDQLESVRDRLLHLTQMIDQQAQMALQEAGALLQAIIDSPEPDEVITANLPLIDYTFLQVLSANIQEAERRRDIAASARLKAVYSRVVAALQADMPPELRFINEVLGVETDAEARSLIASRLQEFDGQLIAAIDAVQEQIAGQAEPEMADRLRLLRTEALQAFS
jgi:hypothetical protein